MILAAAVLGALMVLIAWREAQRYKARRQWTGPETGRLVETLTDPRETAAILLVQTALYNARGEVSAGAKAHIRELMQTQFGCDAEEAERLYSFGRMAIGQIGDARESLSRLLRPVRDRLTLEEMKALVAMMMEVAGHDGAPSAEAMRLVSETREALHVDLALHLPQ